MGTLDDMFAGDTTIHSFSDADFGGGEVVDLKPGTYLGRYMILDLIGQGGMGAVYKAYDPDLDRRIALKVLRVKGRTDTVANRARERLLREAQALAQLSHPNVVAAYDVGTIGLDVFVAMELIEGRTVRDWINQTGPSMRQIVSAMVDAGRGIAAAHKTGLIHRDIKPDNIVVGNDGRVRVLDFGLARAMSWKEWMGENGSSSGQSLEQEQIESDSESEREAFGVDSTGGHRESETAQEMVSLESPLKIPLTMAGSVMGTPGYMAPEQYLGRETTEATDQFCFCVTLYEVLYGVRPHEGKTFKELKQQVTGGVLRTPPPQIKVPAWIRRILARGMSIAREDRFPSMDDLLEHLSKDPARLWKRIGLVTGVTALVVASFVMAAWWQAKKLRMCQGAEALLAGVWDPDAQIRISEAFRASGRSHSEDTFRRVSQILDRQAKDWVRVRTEACEATRVRGEQSEQLLDLRMRCLDRRLSETRALVDLFASKPDGEVVDKAVQAAYELPSLETCSDVEALLAAVPPPEDPRVRAEVEALRSALDEAVAFELAGKYRDGLEVASAVLEEAQRLGYRPLEAESLVRRGWLESRTGDFKAGEQDLFLACQRAAEAKDDKMFASAGINLVYTISVQQARFAEALALTRLVDAVVARSGNSPRLRADSLCNAGYILFRQGDYAEAQKKLEQALLLTKQSLGPDHPKVGHVNNQLANVYLEQGKDREAQRLLEQALEIWQKAFGPDHPSVATALNNLAQVQLQQGRYEEARKAYERVLGIWQATLGPEHPKVAIPLHNLGEVFAEQGRCDEAMEYYNRALPIYEKGYGPEHMNVTYTLTGMGECLVQQKKPEQALALLERALRIRDRSSADKNAIARTSFALAKALWDSGRDRRRAVELAAQARDALQTGGPAREKSFHEVEAWLTKHRIPGRS